MSPFTSAFSNHLVDNKQHNIRNSAPVSNPRPF
jgi:hypothetical protein